MRLMQHPRAIENLEIRVVGGEYLVHDQKNRKVHVLNMTAAKILELCDGSRSNDDIARLICDETHAEMEQVTGDVTAIVSQFAALNLVR